MTFTLVALEHYYGPSAAQELQKIGFTFHTDLVEHDRGISSTIDYRHPVKVEINTIEEFIQLQTRIGHRLSINEDMIGVDYTHAFITIHN